MDIETLLSDEAVLVEIGRRLARRRVAQNFTQAALAEQAGVSKRTVERVENGESTQMSIMIRIFRVLELLGAFDALIPETGTRPLDLLKTRGKERRRASSKNRSEKADRTWSWGDEG